MCDYCEYEDINRIILETEVLDPCSFGWRTPETKICQDEAIKYNLAVFIDRGYLRLVDPKDCDCMDHGEKIKIKFCMFCGKEL